ncbi:TetR/AcrR family transcriptional regulator [Streptomyces sp. NPDC001508]|uniref:TetR/AcrR family transcriptional regulator n=1 Tax=Streptomyces sp. NPDC001508 TaxID=3154656 RepID=UPI003316957B
MVKQQRGQATVDQLLAAALQVYADEGQQGFTVTAVVKASGVSLGSLYHHFGSFDGLAVALYIRCMERLFASLADALERSRTARSGLRRLVDAYFRFTREHRDAALFLHGSVYAGYIGKHAQRIQTAKETQTAPMVRWLGERMRRGEIAPLSPAVVEIIVMGPITEAARRWLSSTYTLDLAEIQRDLPDVIWRSLAPDTSAGNTSVVSQSSGSA